MAGGNKTYFQSQITGGTGTFNTLLYGTGVPASSTGNDGDFYIDMAANYIYGPKASGAWPAGISIVGPAGASWVSWDGGDPADINNPISQFDFGAI